VRVERLGREDVARLGGDAAVAEHVRSRVPAGSSVEEPVREILASVRERGDEAVLEHTRRLDTGGSEPKAMLVPQQELDAALEATALDVVAGLQVAIANVASVADAIVGRGETDVALAQGHEVTVREMPVDRAAVYVPGGRAAYPSTVVMGVVTARAAGVVDVCVCTPPGPDGQAHASILAACRLCGVERVYRMGGAQAIAALAFGTGAVQRADVVVGPGNLYVQEAKRQLSHLIGIDGFAGPSDLTVVFGQDADTGLVALDMLAQAEHGSGSLVVGISSSGQALDALQAEIERDAEQGQAGGSGARGESPSACVLIEALDPQQGVELANALAPEHLQLVGAAEEALERRVRAAGALFVGRNGATAFGDYAAGSNHVLPTGGAARFASMLSPAHFRRRMSIVRIGDAAAAKLAKAGAAVARAEGFPMHAESMEARVRENQRS
jgi:histidinol dehydrogenase